MAIDDAKAQQKVVHNKAAGNRRMHIYVNETTDKIVRSECEKHGVTIADYIVATTLSFHADEASKKLDVTLRKLKSYMNKKGIKYSQRRCHNGKKKRKC